MIARRIYLRNLPKEASKQDIVRFINLAGATVEHIIYNQKVSSPYAIVYLDSKESCHKVCLQLDGKTIGDAVL